MKLIDEVQKVVDFHVQKVADFHVEQYGLDAKLIETMAQVITKRVAEKCVEIAEGVPICGLGKAGADRAADAIRTHFELGGE